MRASFAAGPGGSGDSVATCGGVRGDAPARTFCAARGGTCEVALAGAVGTAAREGLPAGEGAGVRAVAPGVLACVGRGTDTAGVAIAADPIETVAAGTDRPGAGRVGARPGARGGGGGTFPAPLGGGGGGGAARTGTAAGVGVRTGTGVVAGRAGTGPPGPVATAGRPEAAAPGGPEPADEPGTGLRNGFPPPGTPCFGAAAAGNPSTVAGRGAATPGGPAGAPAAPTGRSEGVERVAGGRTCWGGPDRALGDAGVAGSGGAPLCGGFPPSRG